MVVGSVHGEEAEAGDASRERFFTGGDGDAEAVDLWDFTGLAMKCWDPSSVKKIRLLCVMERGTCMPSQGRLARPRAE
jgi:hypothetical protein